MNLGNWDFQLAISRPEVNRALAKYFSKIDSGFDITQDDKLLGKSVHLNGVFEAWEIVGGVGKYLKLRLPIATGGVTINGKNYSLNGCAFLVTCTLGTQIDSAQTTRTLTFDFSTAADAKNPHDGDGVANCTSIEVPSLLSIKNSTLVKLIQNIEQHLAGRENLDLVRFAINACLVNNANKFSPPFVSLQALATGHGAGSWIAPKTTAYGIHQPKGNSESYLVVAGAIAVTPPANPQVVLETELVPDGTKVAIAVSGKAFMEHLVNPVLPVIPPFTMPTIELPSQSSQTRLVANRIHYMASGKANYKGGITSSYDVDQKIQVIFDKTAVAIKFALDSGGICKSSTSKSLLGWVVSISRTILQPLTNSGDLIIDILTLMDISKISNAMASNAGNSFYGFGTIKGMHGDSFSPTEAGIQDVFYMRGSLT